MLLYNTTYSVHHAVQSRWLQVMQTAVIPSFVDDGFSKPALFQVDYQVDPDFTNFALHLVAPDRTMLHEWIEHEKPTYDAELHRMFADKVLSFSTTLIPVRL